MTAPKEFFVKRDTVLDTVSDVDGLASRSKEMYQKFDNIAGVRKEHDDLSVWTSWGRRYGGTGEYKHVARIPDGVLSAILSIKPDFLQDRKGFYAWLNRHKRFSATPEA